MKISENTAPTIAHMPKLLWLLVFTLVALFPVGWLGTQWSAIDESLGWLFATVPAHAVGHISIFFCLGLAFLIGLPVLQRQPIGYASLMLALGVVQEFLQLIYKQRPIEFDEFRDLGTDIIGFVLAFAVLHLFRIWRNRTTSIEYAEHSDH